MVICCGRPNLLKALVRHEGISQANMTPSAKGFPVTSWLVFSWKENEKIKRKEEGEKRNRRGIEEATVTF